MIPIDELIEAPTGDQVNERVLDNLEAAGLRARSWRQGGALRTIIRILSIIIAAFASSVALLARGQFLDLATGGWLKWLAYYVYGVTRIEATFAGGEVTLTNKGGGIFPNVQPGGLIVSASSTGKTYRNTTAFSLGIGESVTIPVEAFEIGSASSAAAGTVDTIDTVSFEGVEVTNALAIIGTDVEPAEQLRTRCRDSRGQRGTRAAYRYATRSAKRADGSFIGVSRDKYIVANGVVRVVCATPSGAPSLADRKDIRASIEELARVDTDTVIVDAAFPSTVAGTVRIWAVPTAGITAAFLIDEAQKALLAFMPSYPIGGYTKTEGGIGYLWATAIESVVKAVHPSIYDVDLVGGDVALGVLDVVTLASTFEVAFVGAPS